MEQAAAGLCLAWHPSCDWPITSRAAAGQAGVREQSKPAADPEPAVHVLLKPTGVTSVTVVVTPAAAAAALQANLKRVWTRFRYVSHKWIKTHMERQARGVGRSHPKGPALEEKIRRAASQVSGWEGGVQG